MDIVKKLLPYIILIGCLSYILVTSFGLDNHLLIKTTINNITFYKFDLNTYLQGIHKVWTSYVQSWTDMSISTDIRPFPTGIDILAYFRVFGHNFFVVIGWLMAPMSILTYFGNFWIFAVQMLLALIGMPTESTILIVLQYCKELANIPNYVINGIQNIL